MKKRKIKTRFLLICFMILVMIVFAKIYNEQAKLLNRKTVELNKLAASIKKEKKLNKSLVKESKEKDSKSFVERIARDKLNMVKPNEILYVDINNNN